MPASQWPDIRSSILDQLDEISVGPPEDFTNFLNAVIDQRAFDKIVGYIEQARADDNAEIITGGDYDDSEGYFIEPTVIVVEDPHHVTMEEEIFGPVTTVYVYPDEEFAETLDLVDNTSPYGLTGAIFATDREAVVTARNVLEQSAGNFYINDKPTGAVVGQQPFGGARRSGTNDKAGSKLNLMRWVSPRAIKETFDPPQHFGYVFHQPDATEQAASSALGAGDGSPQPASGEET
jgi:1-pyrroline-5-carboxylate dehydrogenase